MTAITDKPLNQRQLQVLGLVRMDPTLTLQQIADTIGVTREAVRQISIKLQEMGLIADRNELRQSIIRQEKEAKRETEERTRSHRKRIWLKMTYIAQRIRLRRMAHIDHLGIVRGYHAPGQEAVCQFEGCSHSVSARGFCGGHYGLLRETGALWVRRSSHRFCTESDCDRYVYARGMCRRHYGAWARRHLNNSQLPAHNTSGYRGVTLEKSTGRWVANIRRPGEKQEHLGTFESKETAARAYDTAARKYLGDRAKLNFPDENIEVVKEKREPLHPSGYRGVSWEEKRKRWQVRITRNGQMIYVGRFLDLEKAARAHDSAARYYFGAKAQLNFPGEDPAPYVLPVDRPKEKTSRYLGVYPESEGRHKWVVRLRTDGKYLNLGRFDDEEMAARAYDAGVREYIGHDAPQNFPGENIEVIRPPRSGSSPRSNGTFRPKTSPYRGVSWHRQKSKWDASLQTGNKRIHRYFTDELEAARAYDQMAREHFGERAILNFPENRIP